MGHVTGWSRAELRTTPEAEFEELLTFSLRRLGVKVEEEDEVIATAPTPISPELEAKLRAALLPRPGTDPRLAALLARAERVEGSS